TIFLRAAIRPSSVQQTRAEPPDFPPAPLPVAAPPAARRPGPAGRPASPRGHAPCWRSLKDRAGFRQPPSGTRGHLLIYRFAPAGSAGRETINQDPSPCLLVSLSPCLRPAPGRRERHQVAAGERPAASRLDRAVRASADWLPRRHRPRQRAARITP